MGAGAPQGEVHAKEEQHLRVAFRLLRQGQSPQAFGELVHASRSLPMTGRLAAALVTVSLQAGTEAVAISLLTAAAPKVEGAEARKVRRQLVRVLRRADQLPRAIETLEVLLASFPDDHGARRVLHVLLERTGRWEALASSLEREAQQAVLRGAFARAARAARWRARVQADQLRNLSWAADSYGQVASYLEKMGDEDGAFSVRLDGLRVLRASGASEAVLTAAASECMSEASRLGREAQARQLLEELGLAAVPEVASPAPAPMVEMYLPRLQALLDAAFAGKDGGAFAAPEELAGPQDLSPEGPPPAPLELWEDAAAQQRLEAQLIARKSWRELAQFYLTRADRATDPGQRTESLTRLAELMENELGDPSGASRIYREIVRLTGDRDALKEQLRLLAQRGDPSLIRRALDEAVRQARTPKARAAAHLTRAERALAAGETAQAKADFEMAEALTPGMLLVLAGLVRCVSPAERPGMAQRLRAALSAAPRRSPDRLEALRVLASAAEGPLGDARLAQWAWAEVLAEDSSENQARERLLELARTLGDKAALCQLLRERIAHEPRGAAARLARLELVASLEDSGDADGALNELRQAVRFEPGHKEAWLLLADRLTERGQIGEAAWAMEHAASATEDEAERQHAWGRLASFCYNVLKDPARGEMYSRRAENLRQALRERSAPSVPEPPRSPAPRRETGTRSQVLIPSPPNLERTPTGQPFADITDPALIPAEQARPGVERSTEHSPEGRMLFADDEKTVTDGPEGFVPPGAAALAPPPEKVARPAAAPPRQNPDKKRELEPQPPSRELNAPPEEEAGEESGHTSPFLSAWAQKRPPAPFARPLKARASEPPRAEQSAFARVSLQEPEEAPPSNSPPVQNTSFISWEAPPGKMEPVRRVARARAGPSPRRGPSQEPPSAEPEVFKQVREHPLEAALYEEIAGYFHHRGDMQRAELMKEIASALEGRESPAPRPPHQPLSAEERSGLRHPLLRSPSGELLACVGMALCRLFPMHGRAAGTRERLHPSLGAGAPGAIEALAVSQRLLGLEAPEVVLSEDHGPPFSLVFTSAPRLLVGKQAVRQVLPAPELRFYAGRALLCLGPDLLALRCLKKDQVLRGLALLSSLLKDRNASGLEARVMRESLTPRQIEEAAALFGHATRDFNVSALADAARDSSNRAGLVACGAVGPALAALRMKRALEREVVELVRFAASERYFQLRALH